MELSGIGGVLSYSTAGHGKICGQVLGANGAGQFCLIFMGSPEEAEEMARQHLRNLERDGHREITAIFAPNDDLGGYHGNPVRIVTQKTAQAVFEAQRILGAALEPQS